MDASPLAILILRVPHLFRTRRGKISLGTSVETTCNSHGHIVLQLGNGESTTSALFALTLIFLCPSHHAKNFLVRTVCSAAQWRKASPPKSADISCAARADNKIQHVKRQPCYMPATTRCASRRTCDTYDTGVAMTNILSSSYPLLPASCPCLLIEPCADEEDTW
jgi:hypothetical protein